MCSWLSVWAVPCPGLRWLALLDVLEDFVHLVQLVAQLRELHVDLGEFHVGVLLGGDSHFRQAAVLLAGGQLGPCLIADGVLPSPLVDGKADQASDDHYHDDEGDGGRVTHDPPPRPVRCPRARWYPRP